MVKKTVIIPIFIPHKGCQFDCVFCNQKSISGQMEEMTITEMEKIINTHLLTIRDGILPQIAFYGGSFTGIPILEQVSFLECAYKYIKDGKVSSIRLSTRPDYITQEILDCLKKYGVETIELGVQSLDDVVLKKSCRGHSSEQVIKAVKLIKDNGFLLGIQTMIGLPGDCKEKAIKTAEQVINLIPDCVRIYPTMVIKGTYLNKLFEMGEYTPLDLEQAVDICSELCEIYYANNINVIRIGLQTTENINEGQDITAGPFHPAFRQLVESRLFRKRIEKKIKIIKEIENKEMKIYVGNKYISTAIGQKKDNITYLKSKYRLKDITVIGKEHENFEFLEIVFKQ